MLLRLLPCLAILFAVGCSTFEKRFTEASQTPAKGGKFTGAYSGKWTSASHPGGGGNLRCILSQVNASDYLANFHATWHGFHSEHSVVLHTKPAARKERMGFSADERSFEGTSKLRTPIGSGTYTCKGSVDIHSMQACYDATYDRGTFEMSRVARPASQH